MDEIDAYIELDEFDPSDFPEITDPEVILLIGPARVGKTTMAKMLATNLLHQGFNPVLLSFADPIKEDLEKQGIVKGMPAYRQAAIDYGTAARAMDPDFFVKRAKEKIEKLKEKHKEKMVAIIDDCRYLNEFLVHTPSKMLLFGLYPDVWKNIEDWNADFRSDPSEALARIQCNSDEDPNCIEHLAIDPGPNQTIDQLSSVELDLYVCLWHDKDWKRDAENTALHLTDLIVSIKENAAGPKKDPANES